jgi:hypothetical protein
MATPQDIERQPWDQEWEWTTPAFRSRIILFLKAFVREHNWAVSWSVLEKVVDHGVNVALPTGQAGDPDTIEEGFRSRKGPRVLILRVKEAAQPGNHGQYELGLTFNDGPFATDLAITQTLGTAKSFFEKQRVLRVGGS